jgi:ATP-dependent helicase/nuclease subunit A
MERDRRGWLMGLHGFPWEEPPGIALKQTERRYLDAERRRVIYVAATRARDLLVIPRAGTAAPGKMICSDLLAGQGDHLVHELLRYEAGASAPWASDLPHARRAWRQGPEGVGAEPPAASELEALMATRWADAAEESGRPRFSPTSVTMESHAMPPVADTEDGGAEPPARKPRQGRFGSAFGHAVHHALGLVLRDPSRGAADAATRAAAASGLTEHIAGVAEDVERAIAALTREGITGPTGPHLQLEYPVAGAWDGGRLLSGFVDLVAVQGERLDIIDFKTDAPPAGAVEQAYPEYAGQVRLYARLLESAGIGAASVRCGLLFTGDGAIRWIEAPRGGGGP